MCDAMPRKPLITARLSAKAQTVIPKQIRNHLGIGPGDIIVFEERDGEVLIKPLRTRQTEDPFALFQEWSSDADEDGYADL